MNAKATTCQKILSDLEKKEMSNGEKNVEKIFTGSTG